MKQIFFTLLISSVTILANANPTEKQNQYYQNTKSALACMQLNHLAYNQSEEKRHMNLAWQYGEKASDIQYKIKPFLRSEITREYQIYDPKLNNRDTYIGYYIGYISAEVKADLPNELQHYSIQELIKLKNCQILK